MGKDQEGLKKNKIMRDKTNQYYEVREYSWGCHVVREHARERQADLEHIRGP